MSSERSPDPGERSFYVHPTAVVDEGAEIGLGTKIWHFCHIMSGAKIREGCVLGQNVFVASKAMVGRGCKIQNNVSLYDGVILGEEVFCGPSMVFTNVLTPRAHLNRREAWQETRIGRRVSFGANCTVVCGIRVGDYAFVGAGAVLTRDVLPHALMLGVPARRHGWACSCGVALKERARGCWHCPECDTRYMEREGELRVSEEDPR